MKWRLVSLAIIGVAALIIGIVAVGAKSPSYTTGNSSAEITAALSDYDSNAANADNVYQQQVVNGWVAKDLLTINDRQNVTMLAGQAEALSLQIAMNSLLRGVVVLLVLLIAALMVGFSAVLRLVHARSKDTASGASGSPSDPADTPDAGPVPSTTP